MWQHAGLLGTNLEHSWLKSEYSATPQWLVPRAVPETFATSIQ